MIVIDAFSLPITPNHSLSPLSSQWTAILDIYISINDFNEAIAVSQNNLYVEGVVKKGLIKFGEGTTLHRPCC